MISIFLHRKYNCNALYFAGDRLWAHVVYLTQCQNLTNLSALVSYGSAKLLRIFVK